MIELCGLSAGYAGRVVLREVSLAPAPGKVTILLGPNGCGKSTLLRTIPGLLPALGGRVLLDGVPVEQLSTRSIAQKIAYLPQSRTVPNITARRMVLHGRFPYLSYPRRYRPEDYAAADHALQWMGADDLANCPMAQLSGGQRQKIYLAMALAQATETILMDEPTTYLDARCQLEVMRAAQALAAQGKTVVLVLHDLCLALRYAGTVVVLADGGVAQQGTPEEIYQSGVLDRVFGVALRRMHTADGWQYYYV